MAIASPLYLHSWSHRAQLIEANASAKNVMVAKNQKPKRPIPRSVGKDLKNAEQVLEAYPGLKSLGIALLKEGNLDAAEQFRKVGIALADVLYYGAVAHKTVQEAIKTADTIPISLPAFHDIASVHVSHIYDALGFGIHLGVRISERRGGPKRFHFETSPSFIALELFYVVENFIIPEDSVTQRECRRREVQNEIASVRREVPGYIEKTDRLRLGMEIALLPRLSMETFWTWAEIGARLMVDFRDLLDEIRPGFFPPPIPEEWIASAAKRKGKRGALRDVVRKKLESGFKALSR